MSIESVLNEDNALLLEMLREDKNFIDTSFTFPNQEKELQLELVSWSNRNRYILYINRKSKIKTRYTLQTKHRESYILLRLDLDNKTHRNPDGQKIGGNHLHIFDRDDMAGSWAFELDDAQLNEVFPGFDFSEITKNGTTPIEQFRLFCTLCNATNLPSINDQPVNDTLDF